MRKAVITATTVFALALSYNLALAGKSSVELGNKLFNDTSLADSTNDKSCASCHPSGEGLEKAGIKKKLAKTINRCITGALQGQKMDGRSVEMRSLKMYIKSLK